MELTKINSNLRLREFKAEELDQILKTRFRYWLANLLSLSEDKEENVLNAIEGIKYHGIGFTLNDIVKVFKMYANGELEVQPISNHIDYILVGKIFNEYKKLRTKPQAKVLPPERVYTEEEKENLIYSGVLNCFESYVQYQRIDDGYFWVGKYLGKKGLIKFTAEEREILMQKAEYNVRNKAKDDGYFAYKKVISQLERKENTKVEVEFIYLGLAKYFDKLIAQNKHIKDLI